MGPDLDQQLDTHGIATVPDLLTPEQCAELVAMFDDDARFRSTVVMQRVGFGAGTYRYLADPLPPLVQHLRTTLYPHSVFVEQRPRQQSRPVVLRPRLGEAVVFPVRHRPRLGARGWSRVQLRHGVSAVHSGTRHVLGVIFHNARR